MIREDAQLQVADWQKLRPLYTRRLVGGTGPSGLMAEFAAGTLGTSEYLAELSELGFNGQEQQIALQEARAVRDRKTRGQLISWLHERYIKGEVLEGPATSALVGFGLDAEDVGNLLRLWRVELEVMPKEPTAQQLLDWQCKGIITDDELVSRLAQMKWQAEDIANMIAVNELKCANQQVAKASKYLQQNQRGLDKAQQRWNKLLALAEKKFGKVSQRTKTRAGQVLSVIKHELEGAPPPAKSLAGRAAAVLTQGSTNGAATAQPPSTAGSPGPSYPAAPAAGYPGSTATVASGAAQSQAPPTAESVITGAATAPAAGSSPSYPQPPAPSPAPTQYPTPAESETPAT